MSIPRSLLVQAFPDNPRLRAQMETVLDLVDSINAQAADLQTQLDAISTGGIDFQPLSDILTAISGLPSQIGAIEMKPDGIATIRPIDGTDSSSLVSRGVLGPYFAGLGNYANDAAAATGGVAVNGLYRNGSAIMVRIS